MKSPGARVLVRALARRRRGTGRCQLSTLAQPGWGGGVAQTRGVNLWSTPHRILSLDSASHFVIQSPTMSDVLRRAKPNQAATSSGQAATPNLPDCGKLDDRPGLQLKSGPFWFLERWLQGTTLPDPKRKFMPFARLRERTRARRGCKRQVCTARRPRRPRPRQHLPSPRRQTYCGPCRCRCYRR